MSQSGATVSKEAVEAFNELKLKKTYKWVIYKLSDDGKSIVVEKTSDQDDYEDFLSHLKDEAPRYAVFDVAYKTEEAGIRNKIVFIAWNSDNAKIKDKMVYSSSKEAIRKALNGVSADVQANDKDDLEKEEIIKKLQKGK